MSGLSAWVSMSSCWRGQRSGETPAARNPVIPLDRASCRTRLRSESKTLSSRWQCESNTSRLSPRFCLLAKDSCSLGAFLLAT